MALITTYQVCIVQATNTLSIEGFRLEMFSAGQMPFDSKDDAKDWIHQQNDNRKYTIIELVHNA